MKPPRPQLQCCVKCSCKFYNCPVLWTWRRRGGRACCTRCPHIHVPRLYSSHCRKQCCSSFNSPEPQATACSCSSIFSSDGQGRTTQVAQPEGSCRSLDARGAKVLLLLLSNQIQPRRCPCDCCCNFPRLAQYNCGFGVSRHSMISHSPTKTMTAWPLLCVLFTYNIRIKAVKNVAALHLASCCAWLLGSRTPGQLLRQFYFAVQATPPEKRTPVVFVTSATLPGKL